MSVRVTAKTDGIDRLLARLRAFSELSITIGYQGESGEQLYASGVTVAMVGRFMEFGTEDVPARSHLRKAMFSKRNAIANLAAREIGKSIRGLQSEQEALEVIGQFAADAVADYIRRGNFKALAASTIERKGHGRPLIDSQTMLRSVSWAIRRDGRIIKQGLAT